MGWTNVGAAILQAVTVIVSGASPTTGIFVYSPSPGAGNLVGSWTATTGTDPYGNTFQDGIAVYGTAGSFVQLFTTGSNVPAVVFDTGQSTQSATASVFNIVLGDRSQLTVGATSYTGHISGINPFMTILSLGRTAGEFSQIYQTADQLFLDIGSQGIALKSTNGQVIIQGDTGAGFVVGGSNGVFFDNPTREPTLTYQNNGVSTGEGLVSDVLGTHHMHFGSFGSGVYTTDASGNVGITHGASFTPSGVICMYDITAAGGGPFCSAVFNIGATQFGSHWESNGASYNNGALNGGHFICWG